MNTTEPQIAELSIGALSKATGIPVPTIRSWEHRYGYPVPVRLPSGHRRYQASEVQRMRRIKGLIAQGFPAGSVVNATNAELDLMTPASRPGEREREQGVEQGADEDEFLEQAIAHVMRLDGVALERTLQLAWSSLGARAFVFELAAPFVRAIGDRWQQGELAVRQEHFASQHMGELLGRMWRPLRERADGAVVVAASLSGEQHTLGLQMAGILLSLGGCQVVFLGADSPVDEVVRAVEDVGARAVLVGASSSMNRKKIDTQIAKLRDDLGKSVALAVGGISFVPDSSETTALAGLESVPDWALSLNDPVAG